MSKAEIKKAFQYNKIDISNTNPATKTAKPRNSWHTIKRIFTYLKQYKWMLFLVIFAVLASSGLSLLGPYLVGMTIDDFIVTKRPDGLLTILILLIIVYILHALSIFLQNYWMIGIAQKTVYTLRKDVFEQFHRLPISYFDKRQQGELMSRVTNDIDNINNTLNQSVIQIFSSVITLVGTVTVMLLLSPLLTLITMTIIPIMFFAMRAITKRTGPLYKVQQKDLGELNGFIEEMVSGQEVVKVFSQEKRVINEFDEKNKQLQLSSFWAQTIAGFIPKVMNTLNFLSFAFIAFFGGILAIKGYITVGVIVIFTEYARQFTRPLNELSNQFNILLSAIAGAERVFQVLDEQAEEDDEVDAVDIHHVKGHFIFDDVTFGYDETPILKNIHFEVQPGEMVAFVGHTGAGKTTIINLISRFYNYDFGEILLDGIPLNQIKRASLRQHMAFVLQDSFLFQDTVKENIRYGKMDATDEEVIEAAKRANAHDFIMRLPNGYETVLDQERSSISKGQVQLITIARAMIADPEILILDEATSNIDTITELNIQAGLQALMKNRTSFVIAHRLNTIQRADQIIMLEHGEIIERGTHAQLLRKKGTYYDLFQT